MIMIIIHFTWAIEARIQISASFSILILFSLYREYADILN